MLTEFELDEDWELELSTDIESEPPFWVWQFISVDEFGLVFVMEILVGHGVEEGSVAVAGLGLTDGVAVGVEMVEAAKTV